MITGTDTLSYDYITLLVKCGIHNLVDHITRYTTTVDTHTKAHGSFSWLLDDIMDEIYYNYDRDCLSTMYPWVGSIINPLLGLVPNEMDIDSLSCDYRSLLVKCGIHTLADHTMHDTTTVNTHTKAHGSFSWLLEDIMDEIYYNYDRDCLSTMYSWVGSIINPLLGLVANENGYW
jgi:hypothetical protein